MRSVTKSSTGFTLIEMLVSIAILVVLVAIIFLGMGYARQQMGITKCMSNFRQIYTALMSYTQDHNGMMPGPLTSTMTPYFKMSNKGEPTSNQLSGYLAPYLNVTLPEPGQEGFNHYLSCPAFLETLTPAERVDPQIKRTLGIANADALGCPFGYAQSATPTTTREPKNFHTYTAKFPPSETWMMRDIDAENVPTPSVLIPEPIHKRGRNFLFADGSVRFLTPGQ